MKHIINFIFSAFFTFAIFSCNNSKNADSIPAVVVQEEIQSENKRPSPQPIVIADSQVKINDHYELQIFAANNWYKFVTALPEMDLTQQEFKMTTTSDLNAKLKCLDSHCSKSEISVLSTSGQHQLHIEQLKAIPIGGEFLKNCELPLFFEYEFDELIGNNTEFKKALKNFAMIDQLEITFAQIGTLRENQEMANISQRVRFKFSTGNKTLFTTDIPSVKTKNNSLVARLHHRYLKKVSLNPVESRSDRSFDWVRFHFPLNSGNEICYHMSIIPQIL